MDSGNLTFQWLLVAMIALFPSAQLILAKRYYTCLQGITLGNGSGSMSRNLEKLPCPS